ncbi:MAG TPA: multidrug effflux MFS transporter [Hyphomicrobium sp.]|jgi:DHA1 family bicyclomycin/chloramphenicol resistance-like MFS transporter
MNASERDRAFATAAAAQKKQMSMPEFIGLVAMMMALTALSIDIMLPALPAIGEALGIADANDRQIVIISYMFGFAAGQLVYGRLSDRYGRKPVLMAGMAIFLAGSLVAALAGDFTLLLAARTVQGIGAAAPRVIAFAIVRDRYSGREMARVMSFAMAIFIIIPVLAPAMGQGLLFVGTWRLMFDLLLVAGIIVALWAGLRLPETMRAQGTQPLPLAVSARRALETPQTIGYAVSGGLLFGCVLGYVSSAQQVFVDVFGLGARFPLAFGATALMIALASLTNAMFVERLGMRRLSHTALAAFIVLSAVLAASALLGALSFWLFIGLMVPLFYLFGLIAPNFNAMAMEPQGDNAGMASSVIGFVSTDIGALAGGMVGHLFDGTVLPLALGFFGLSSLCFALVVWIEGPHGVFHPAR